MNTRRQFLLGCAGIAAAAMGTSRVPQAMAIEPIERPGTPKFKFSLAAYSYRRLLTGESPALTLSDFIRDCARMGLEGTELTSYYFPSTEAEYLAQLKRDCFRLGLDVSGTAIRNDFALEPGEARDQELAHVRQWVDYSAALGAPAIRVFAGHAQPGVSPEETHRRIVTGLEESCAYAGSRGVHLALENHGGPTSTAEGLLAIVRDVQSPWFGVNLDTGNFHETEDLYADLARVAPYAINVQVKVVVPGARGREPMQFERLAGILRDAGYRGYVVLEYEENGDPREECPKYLDQIREAFQA